MKKGIKVLVWILVIGAAAFFLYSFFKPKKTAVQQETRPAVSITEPAVRDITLYTDVIGTLLPAEEVNVMPKMSGEITEVNFELGQRVSAGDSLIGIHSDALDSLGIQVDSAKVQLDSANTNLARTNELYGTGAVSEQQLESAQNAAKSAKLAYDSAATQLNLQKGYTKVTAPISGVIETKNAAVHGMAAPSSVICVISGDNGMEVTFGVSEDILPNMETGNEIELEKSNRSVKGTITEVSGRVSSVSGLYECKASVGDTEGFLSGEKVKVKVVSAKAEGVLTVPNSAVFFANGKPFVYLYDDQQQTAVKTEFESGISDADFMEIKSGLNASSKVITTWSNELYNGVSVMIPQGETQNTAENGSTEAGEKQ